MGILGSAFGRALAGGGQAAVSTTNKYIDEELATQRAQALADIQRTNANNQRADALAFDTDPKNVQAKIDAARTTALAAGDTQNEVDRRRLSDAALNEAARKKAAEDADAQTTAKIAAAKRIATDPDSTEAQRAQAEIDLKKLTAELGARANAAIEVAKGTEQARKAAGAYDRRGTDHFGKLPAGVAQSVNALNEQEKEISKAIIKAKAEGGGMWDPEKNPSQKQLLTELAATRMRRSQLMAPYLEGGSGQDPLGLRGGIPPTTGEQGARDVEAGELMIRSEYGGDIGAARSALAKLDAEAARAQGDARGIMLGEANRLRMGIASYEKRGKGKPVDNQAPAGNSPGILSRLMDSMAPQKSSGPDTGVEGLSTMALERIANDPTHPRQKAAQDALRRQEGNRQDSMSERLNDPTTDPALYQ